MPDEYLLPNALLFLQNLPDGTTKEDLQEVFNQYVARRTYFPPCLLTHYACQVSQSTGSTSHPGQEGYRFRGIRRRGECHGGQGGFAQFQDRRRDQDEGEYFTRHYLRSASLMRLCSFSRYRTQKGRWDLWRCSCMEWNGIRKDRSMSDI